MADKKENPEALPEGITSAKLREYFDIGRQYYQRAFDRMRLLDAADKGRLWEALHAKFPSYQILPDTNSVSWVKENILASIYTVQKSAHLLPTSEESVPLVFEINKWLDHYWDTHNIGRFQFEAGERAALTNIGITQVGWNPSKNSPENRGGVGDIVLKNIDPMQFARDPFSDSLSNAGWCYVWGLYHASVFEKDPRYAKAFSEYMLAKKNGTGSGLSLPDRISDGPNASTTQAQQGTHLLVVFWVRDGANIHEIHTIGGDTILYVKRNILPAMFPFAIMYCNTPAGDLIGTSAPAKIFSNMVAMNIMNSLLLTAEYKNQNPPKFISSSSGLNIGSFAQHGHEADKTFVVSGDASRAVHYHQFPIPSTMTPNIVAKLEADIGQVSGVDGRYTGRDTGSILTTGGIETMLDQATLIDAPKIMNYEQYTRELTHLILANMCEFSPDRVYFIQNLGTEQVESFTVKFPVIKADILQAFAISISSELPKNKQRIANAANLIMEKQMQYASTGKQVELITPEEWLRCQDLPNMELMQERMGIQRSADYLQKVSEVLTTFAELTKNGVDPEEALQMTAASMQASETPGRQMELPMVAPEVSAPPMSAPAGTQSPAFAGAEGANYGQ